MKEQLKCGWPRIDSGHCGERGTTAVLIHACDPEKFRDGTAIPEPRIVMLCGEHARALGEPTGS